MATREELRIPAQLGRMEIDAYRILQVDPQAEYVVVHAAYRALARHYHPDGDAPDTSRMVEINRAYALVRQPELRRHYDGSRRLRPVSMAVPSNPAPRYDAYSASASGGAQPGGSEQVLDFGRYAGWRLTDLARQDPDYLRWLARQSAGIRYRDQIRSLLPNEPDLDRRSSSVAFG
jgi:curved DNA-binding protein CbpA